MKQHQLSALFPAMPEAEYEELKAHIAEHGQQSAIATLDGQVLDGWHRYRACGELGCEPKIRELPKSTDALAFVLGQNLNRRHLDSSHRAIIAAKISNLPHGRSEKKKAAILPLTPAATVEKAAKALNVSPRLVRDAKVVIADEDASKAVDSGEKSVSAAAKELRAPKPKPASKDNGPEPVRDSTGYAIPDPILPLWNRRGEVREILDAISKCRATLGRVMKTFGDGQTPDPLYGPANVSGAHGYLSNAWTTISMALPYAVCPICQGRTPGSCKSCKGRGLISKHTFDNAFPPELIAVREKSCAK